MSNLMPVCHYCGQVVPFDHSTENCLGAVKSQLDYAVEVNQNRDKIIASLMDQRDEAQEAALNYYEAWQDAAIYWKAERDEAIAHREDYETKCIEQSIEIRKLKAQARTERLDQASVDEFAAVLRYCIEQIERRGWNAWDGSFEVSPDGRPYHVQIVVQPTGDNPWNKSR